MQDHGADAATVVANATVDLTKGVLMVSAAGLRQLFLLAMEGSRLKAGETNLDKLLKSVDAGDTISSVTIQKDDAEKLAGLAKKHGVVYAMVENDRGEMIVYYTSSEADRMKHVMEEILGDRVDHGHKENERAAAGEERGASDQKEAPEEEVDPVTALRRGEETEVIFDVEDPNRFVEIRQFEDGSSSVFVHFEDQDPIGPESAELASETVKRFSEPVHFSVKGHYPKERLQSEIANFTGQRNAEKAAREEAQNRIRMLDEINSAPAAIGGTLHTFVDLNNVNNRIAVWKDIEDTGGNHLETITRSVVYLDGQRAAVDPKEAFLSFDRYRYTEKSGGAAGKQFEKMEEASSMSWKREQTIGEEGDINDEELAVDIDKKPLSQYLKDIEKIKQKPQDSQMQNRELQIKDPVRGER